MLNNKLCLTSVVEFLRRGRVNRGTGGGKLVVVVDSSKRKVSNVHVVLPNAPLAQCQVSNGGSVW